MSDRPNIGDRVRLIRTHEMDEQQGLSPGMVGVVVKGGKDACVEFAGWDGGHSGPHRDCRFTCWHIEWDDVESLAPRGPDPMTTRQWWRISIGGYGAFAFYGDESEAEDMRAHKARWEGGAGRKEPMPADDPMVAMEITFRRREHERGTPMDARELEAIGATA